MTCDDARSLPVLDLAVAGGWQQARLRDAVRAVLNSASWRADGVAVIGGLPTAEGQAGEAVTAISRAVGKLLPQDSAGSLVRAVQYRGVRLGEGEWARYSDSRDGGSLHTDGPHRPGAPPAAFALLCVRQAATGGHLILVSTAQIVQRLEPSVRAVLTRPFAFDRREPGSAPVLRPILERSHDGWRLAYLRSYVDIGHRHPRIPALTESQLDALETLDRTIGELATEAGRHLCLKLRPGQLALIDNRRNVHGRTGFGDAEDDRDRLMLRTWIDDGS